ncbi:hypothetical protein ACFQJD_03720 [Haloplanus sp. GCM10025708]|uniref:DUF7311 family protein n=1 Tax=Haloplanus sp. GCM10025708 TaxID=3252679 RepID=UPI0036180D6E
MSYFAVGGRPNGTGDENAVAYRVAGQTARTVRLSGVDLRTPGGPVVFREAGRHRLRLSLVRDRGVAVVVVRRAGDADPPRDSNTER